MKEAVRFRVPAGNHYFLAGNNGTSLLKAEVQAGKEYFVWLDNGKLNHKVRLTPISPKKAKKLKKWLEPVLWVELDSEKITPRFQERGSIVSEFIKTEVENPESKRSNFQLLGTDHAFDEQMLKGNGISKLISEGYN